MWREYTREVPARNGFAIVFSTLALSLTTGLAWVMARAEQTPIVLNQVEALRFWPIEFRLPDGFVRTDHMDTEIWFGKKNGVGGAAQYVKGPIARPEARLQFTYHLDEGTKNLEELIEREFGVPLSEGDAIRMGPLTGQAWYLRDVRTEDQTMVAIAVREDGLIILVTFDAATTSGSNRRLFRQICESITYQSWSVPDPKSGLK